MHALHTCSMLTFFFTNNRSLYKYLFFDHSESKSNLEHNIRKEKQYREMKKRDSISRRKNSIVIDPTKVREKKYKTCVSLLLIISSIYIIYIDSCIPLL